MVWIRIPIVFFLMLGTVSAARAEVVLRVFGCRFVEVQIEDARERKTAEHVASILCRVAPDLAKRFGVDLSIKPIELIVTEDMRSFTKRTGMSFFTAGVHFNGRIITPPAGRLRESMNVEDVLKHELVHLLVYRLVGNRCPIWLNEGLAQHYEGRAVSGTGPTSEAELNMVERVWRSKGSSILERRQAYVSSLAITTRLMKLVGEKELLAALPRLADNPNALELEVSGKVLRIWLFTNQQPAQAQAQGQVEIHRGPLPPDELKRDQPKEDTGVSKLPIKELLKKAKKNK
ncbi:MAG: hypothetical protein JRF33_17120 [Deltaproteobacteria bacterium]|nr:hypothetical protein [Deltaproteobacteria bacterium]